MGAVTPQIVAAVRHAIKDQKVTQRDVAGALGLSANGVCAILTKQSTSKHIEAICAYLGVSVQPNDVVESAARQSDSVIRRRAVANVRRVVRSSAPGMANVNAIAYAIKTIVKERINQRDRPSGNSTHGSIEINSLRRSPCGASYCSCACSPGIYETSRDVSQGARSTSPHSQGHTHAPSSPTPARGHGSAHRGGVTRYCWGSTHLCRASAVPEHEQP